jgi:CRISPR/Cas system CMR-associated protein Cmr5 small subunit
MDHQEKAFFEAMKSSIDDWYQRALDFTAVGYMKNIVSTYVYEVQDITGSPSFLKLSAANQSKIRALIAEQTARLEKVLEHGKRT